MSALKHLLRMREITILASVLLAVAVFGALNPRFLGVGPALAILEGASTDGLMVIGMTIVIVCGAFDMSVGSTMSLCGLVAASGMKAGDFRCGWPWPRRLASRRRRRLDQRRDRHPAENQSLHHHAGHDEHPPRHRAGRHAQQSADRAFPRAF